MSLRILLVTPGRKGLGNHHLAVVVQSSVAPADVATVAALTPAGHDVEIWDEALEGELKGPADLPGRYDIIGVGGFSADYARTIAIGRALKGAAPVVVVGGVGVSAEPEKYRDVFDVLFIGEAEYTWPKFLSDFQAGNHRAEYRQVSRVDMTDSPPPRWSNNLGRYAWGVVQTTRGCPFDCEFCDVIALFGRKPRHKSISQVLAEVETLQKQGVSSIMLSDDNLYGDRKYGKALLRELAAQNQSFDRRIRYWTQITLDASKDPEMLELLFEANFTQIVIGIESPNIESLIETNKPQNYKHDILAAIHTIHSYGLTVNGSFIVGFDHDDRTIFDRQFAFIQEACLIPVQIGPLAAVPGTKLWTRLLGEHRILKRDRTERVAGLGVTYASNVVPKNMTREELLRGFRDLLARVHAWPAFEERLRGIVLSMERIPPLMLGFKALSTEQSEKFMDALRSNEKARGFVSQLLADPEPQAIKERLHRLVPGESPREVYLRQYIEDAVDAQWNHIHYVLPEVFRSVDRALERLGVEEFESPTFSFPDAFRQPYEAVFPVVYDRIHNGLTDKTLTLPAIVEVFQDFLSRYGATFDGLEDHHQVYLLELCDRTIARENRGDEQTVFTAPEPWLRLDPASVSLIANREHRRSATDVLRAVEARARAARP